MLFLIPTYLQKSIAQKTVKVNIAFLTPIFKKVFDKFSNDMQTDRLCICGSLVVDV